MHDLLGGKRSRVYMVTKLTKQQQIVLGGGWGIESKHVFNRESSFKIVITKAGTVATTVFLQYAN